MNIAELFVSLGVKGSEKTTTALTSMHKGLKDTASMSLEAKAALVGAMYALERLFATSGQAGTNLTNFNALLGMSAQTLQQYQYAARQAGVSNQEVEGTFKALSASMTKMLMGQGAPAGIARVAQVVKAQVGEMQQLAVAATQGHPEALLQKLQEYAKLETNIGLRNENLKGFGISEGMIAAFNRNAFRPEVLSKAPIYGEGEVKRLDQANIAWSNLGNKIEMAFGHFNAAHGGQMVGDISKLVDKVLTLANAFEKLAEKVHLIEGIGAIFESWSDIFSGLTEVVEAFSDPKKMQAIEDNLKAFLHDMENLFDEKTGGIFSAAAKMIGDAPKGTDKDFQKHSEGTTYFPGTIVQDELGRLFKARTITSAPTKKATDWIMLPPSYRRENKAASNENPTQAPVGGAAAAQISVLGGITPETVKRMIAPPVPAVAAQGSTQNVEVNQTLNFQHDGKDAAKTGHSTKKAVQDAYRQMSAQAQGS